jgi:hypothetical protein
MGIPSSPSWPLELFAAGDLPEVPRLIDERVPDQLRVAERQLQRGDSARAGSEHEHVVDAERAEEPGRVVSMLCRATARPGVSTATQRSAAVVGHDREAGQALGDRTPLLGVLTTRVNQEYGRTRTTDFRVQDRAVDGIATDAWWLSVRQRVRVRPKVWLGHSGSVFAVAQQVIVRARTRRVRGAENLARDHHGFIVSVNRTGFRGESPPKSVRFTARRGWTLARDRDGGTGAPR